MRRVILLALLALGLPLAWSKAALAGSLPSVPFCTTNAPENFFFAPPNGCAFSFSTTSFGFPDHITASKTDISAMFRGPSALGTLTISLDASTISGGTVQVSLEKPEPSPFSGVLFTDSVRDVTISDNCPPTPPNPCSISGSATLVPRLGVAGGSVVVQGVLGEPGPELLIANASVSVTLTPSLNPARFRCLEQA